MHIKITVAAIAAVFCASAAPARDSAPPAWDRIAFDIKSWGAPIGSWTIQSDGSGAWVETMREAGADFRTYKLAWHDIPADKAAAQKLGAIIARLPAQAPDSSDCRNMMTDAPYGTIRVTRGATTIEHGFNTGCMDKDYTAFVALLKEADELVSARGKTAPVLRTEPGPG